MPARVPGAGEKIGPYLVIRLIGEGGMGAVLLAEDERLGRQVALKVLAHEVGRDAVARERLVREARAASQISHPNVAALYDVGEFEGGVYLTMEYVEGEPLSRKIGRAGELPVAEIVAVGAQVADALQAAHQRGVVHRDIKPANILVTPNGIAKVVDFGLAMRVEPLSIGTSAPTPERPAENRLTRTGYAAGTIAYMSPEQARGEAPDGRSDLFSLGSVLYEAATGRSPFERPSPLATAAAILHEPPQSLRSLRSEIPAGLAEVVHRCLEKDPARRPESGAAVAAALRLLEAGHATKAVRHALGRRRRPLVAVAATVAAVATVVAVALFFLPRTPPPPEAAPVPAFADVETRRLYDQSNQYRTRGTSLANLRNAVALARRAHEREPQDPFLQAHLASLIARLQLEDRDPAHTAEIESLAASALEKNPRLADAWFARAWSQIGRERYAEALASAEKGRELAPSDWSGYALAGRASIRLGRVDDGLAELRRGLDVEGGHVFTRAVLGYELFRLGRLDEAAAEFAKVLEYQPDHPPALNNLATIYLYTGRYLDSVPLFERLMREAPEENAASNLGTAYYYLDRMPEAISAYTRAMELNPARPDYKRNLGDAHEKLGDAAAARRWYAEALSNCERLDRDGTTDAGSRIIHVLVLAKLGRTGEATAGVERLVSTSPRDMLAQYTAAQVYALAGDRAKTFAFARTALDLGYPREEFRRDPYFGALRTEREFLDLITR